MSAVQILSKLATVGFILDGFEDCMRFKKIDSVMNFFFFFSLFSSWIAGSRDGKGFGTGFFGVQGWYIYLYIANVKIYAVYSTKQ